MQELLRLADRIAATEFSKWLQTTSWIVPTLQSVHILAMAILLTGITMSGVRLAGFQRRREPAPDFVFAQIPWIWAAFLTLVITGTLQTVAEPAREFGNIVFWLKMTLVAVSSILTLLLFRRLRAKAGTSALMKIGGVIVVLLWVTIVVCGRMIAYTQEV